MTDARTQSGAADWVGVVLGNYRIVGTLSSGGMGSVYRAQHELLGRPAAVKVLRPELTANPELVQRFFNEAKAATAIRHPGIVEVYDFGYTDDGHAYLVMELLDGEPLGKRIESRGRLSEIEAANIARGIASALKAAHGKGIIHRDLKPDNVFLVPDVDLPSGERVKVLDFGIAKLADAAPTSTRHTQTGALMGTPLYMAPEQARAAGTIDARADLYSLGCILYELLVGKPPFVAEGAGEIIAMQLFTPPTPPSQLLAELTPEMERIVLRLLEKEPDDRFQSAEEVSMALTAVGARLSGRLSAPFDAAASSPAIRMPTPVPGHLRASFAGDAPMPMAPPEKRSAMPIIAAVLTVALAGAAAIFVFSRGSSSADAPATGSQETASGSAPVVVQPPPPVVVQPPPPPVVKTQAQPVKVAAPPKKQHPTKGPVTTIPNSTGPVTSPSSTDTGPVTSPGAHTTNHSPIETQIDDDPKPPKAAP